jgi:hypothetical protein
MADKITGKTVLGAISDFIILALLIGGAGFAGYYVGINQRLAPIQLVPPGSPAGKTLTQLGLIKDKEPKDPKNGAGAVRCAGGTGQGKIKILVGFRRSRLLRLFNYSES